MTIEMTTTEQKLIYSIRIEIQTNMYVYVCVCVLRIEERTSPASVVDVTITIIKYLVRYPQTKE